MDVCNSSFQRSAFSDTRPSKEFVMVPHPGCSPAIAADKISSKLTIVNYCYSSGELAALLSTPTIYLFSDCAHPFPRGSQ
eukprot:jgi/Botrbrau1/7652/Bobra.0159s0094.1